MNQLRFAGGLLCQAVHVAVMPSPASYCSFTPVILGWSSGKSAKKQTKTSLKSNQDPQIEVCFISKEKTPALEVELPSKELAAMAISYAKEMEKIV